MTTSASPPLEKLIADLSDPAAYPHPVQDVRVEQTHISCVFLTGEYAYKIKKPVDFGFLDYSTLEKRQDCCQKEIRLNGRLCSDVYLDVVPITLHHGQFKVGGAGAAVEWAVRMRQLQEEEILSSRLAAGKISEGDIARIACLLAAFHAEAATGPHIDHWGMPSILAQTIENTLKSMDTLSADLLSTEARGQIRRRTEHFLKNEAELLTARAADGYIRDCHGDLRTQNICLDPRFTGGIQIFDCIEFNHEFRYIDIAADIAYLAMDLDFAGRADLRGTLIDVYSHILKDSTLQRVLPFYQIYRACVRGNIALLATKEAEIPEGQHTALRETAAAAYDLARCYARKAEGPALIITVGFSGSGKSHLAKELRRRLPAVVLSSDEVRKDRASVDRATALPEAHYSAAQRASTYAELYRRAGAHLARGQHVLLDATFLCAEERKYAARLADLYGAEFWILECQCPDDVVRRRLAARQEHGDASDAGVSVYERQLHSYGSLSASDQNAWNVRHVVVNTAQSVFQAAQTVVDHFTEAGE